MLILHTLKVAAQSGASRGHGNGAPVAPNTTFELATKATAKIAPGANH
jgi:hypothetical protein